MLPTEKTPVVNDLGGLTLFVYGPPKIGKSTWCSQVDGLLFLATEPGLNSLEVFQKPITGWPDMMDVCADIAQGDHGYKAIAIDTADNAWSFCSQYICAQERVVHESDLDWGKGWNMVKKEFHRVLTKLAHLPYGLILTSHAKTIEVKTRTDKYNKVIPTLGQGGRDIILGMADMILYCTLENVEGEGGEVVPTRIMRTKPDLFYEAGDRTSRMPETIPLDYAAFLEAFNQGHKEPQE